MLPPISVNPPELIKRNVELDKVGRGNRTKFCCWIVLLLIVGGRSLNAQTGVGTGQPYTTLNNAFDAINNGTLTGSIRLEIRSDILLTATAVLNASGTGSANYSTVTIYPAANYTITSNINGPAIEFAGADRVTIDGRIGALPSGIPYNLVIENTSTGTDASVLRFANGIINSNITHLILKGSGTSATQGIVTFNGTGGSSNNSIQYNKITNSGGNRPVNVAYVNTSTLSNTFIFFGNEIYDVFNGNSNGNGVLLAGNAENSYILNNHFYETSAVSVSGNYIYRPISIESATVTGTLVQANFIGGTQLNAAGGKMTFTSSAAPEFDGIYIAGGTLAAPSSIQNNTITNISFQSSRSNTGASSAPGFFNAIYITGSNIFANVGTVTGNTIGSQTATNAIELLATNSSDYNRSVMIYNNSGGDVNIHNNTMGGIFSSGISSPKTVIGITDAGPGGNHSISNNIIGSATVPNSIEIGQNTTNGLNVNEAFYGIVNFSSADVLISGNTIANITQRETGTSAGAKSVLGIMVIGGTSAIDNNTIHHLQSYSNINYPDNNAVVTGIDVYSASATVSSVSGNTIYDLSAANTGNVVSEVSGIYYGGVNTSPVIIKDNFIHSLSLSSSNSSAKIYGISTAPNAGQAEFSNNIISLGTGVGTGYQIRGINDASTGSSGAHKYYFNTVYIGGSVSGGSNTAAFYLNSATPSGRDIRNNIFYNARANSAGSPKHYGAYFSGAPSLVSDYNDYYAPNTGGIAGFYSTDKTTVPVVTSQDVNSLAIDPLLSSAGGATATNYIPSASLPGVGIAGFDEDYTGATRPANPMMGAFHYVVLPVTWLSFTARWQNDKVVLNWSTANEQNAKDFIVQHSAEGAAWHSIGAVNATGNTNTPRYYSFTDAAPVQGKNYYRIRQRDLDEKSAYSQVRMVDGNRKTRSIQIMSNPITNGILSFYLAVPGTLRLTAPDGRMIWQKQLSAGSHQQDVSRLAKGYYYIQHSSGETISFIVQ